MLNCRGPAVTSPGSRKPEALQLTLCRRGNGAEQGGTGARVTWEPCTGARLGPGAGQAEPGLLTTRLRCWECPVHGRMGLACGVQKRWSQEQGPDNPCSFFLRLEVAPSEPQVNPMTAQGLLRATSRPPLGLSRHSSARDPKPRRRRGTLQPPAPAEGEARRWSPGLLTQA